MDRHDREIQWLITMVNGNCLITVREDQIISMQMAEIRRLIEGRRRRKRVLLDFPSTLT